MTRFLFFDIYQRHFLLHLYILLIILQRMAFMKTYKHLLLATSLNPEHEGLAVKAVQLAEDFSARLSLLHVFEDKDQEHLSQARDALKNLGRRLVVPGFDQRLVIGSLSAAIEMVAQSLKVDAIIIGRKVGDTKQMLKAAPCDVIQILL
jgi:K+-sensing histidine kinase KdpD